MLGDSIMEDLTVKHFIDARNYLNDNLEEMIKVYMSGIWDPLVEHVILKELNRIIETDLDRMFPDLPMKLKPKYSYRLLSEKDEVVEVELSVQQYLNVESGLKFLGNYSESGVPYDLYCAPYYDGINNFLFYARYGHLYENFMTGANDARDEYNLGLITPLAVAYGMAVHDGYIN
jgi:hypothetical protein